MGDILLPTAFTKAITIILVGEDNAYPTNAFLSYYSHESVGAQSFFRSDQNSKCTKVWIQVQDFWLFLQDHENIYM